MDSASPPGVTLRPRSPKYDTAADDVAMRLFPSERASWGRAGVHSAVTNVAAPKHTLGAAEDGGGVEVVGGDRRDGERDEQRGVVEAPADIARPLQRGAEGDPQRRGIDGARGSGASVSTALFSPARTGIRSACDEAGDASSSCGGRRRPPGPP
jgi:hypothetical protein